MPPSTGGDESVSTTAGSSEKNKYMIHVLREKLKAAEEKGDFSLAGSLRRKLNKADAEERKRKEDEIREVSKTKSKSGNDRQVRYGCSATYSLFYWR
jgi:hypothetical protein